MHPNLSKDGQGFVYWKGIRVEHFSYAEERRAEEATALDELAKRCMFLESIGIPVNGSTAVWRWTWFEGMTKDHPYLALLRDCGDMYEHADGRVCWKIGETPETAENPVTGTFRVWDGKALTEMTVPGDDLGNFYHPLRQLGFNIPQVRQGKDNGLCYATLAQMTAFLEKHNVPKNLAAR